MDRFEKYLDACVAYVATPYRSDWRGVYDCHYELTGSAHRSRHLTHYPDGQRYLNIGTQVFLALAGPCTLGVTWLVWLLLAVSHYNKREYLTLTIDDTGEVHASDGDETWPLHVLFPGCPTWITSASWICLDDVWWRKAGDRSGPRPEPAVYDIWTADLPFRDVAGSKRRPVLVLYSDEDEVYVAKITSTDLDRFGGRQLTVPGANHDSWLDMREPQWIQRHSLHHRLAVVGQRPKHSKPTSVRRRRSKTPSRNGAAHDGPFTADHDRLVDLCRRHQEASRWPEVLDTAAQLQQLDPACWHAASWTAHAQSAVGKWYQALPAFRVWAHHDHGNPNGWAGMWQAAVSCGQRAAELEATAGWIQAAPQDAIAWGCHAMALEASGQPDEAIVVATWAKSCRFENQEMFPVFHSELNVRASLGEVHATLDPLLELTSRHGS